MILSVMRREGPKPSLEKRKNLRNQRNLRPISLPTGRIQLSYPTKPTNQPSNQPTKGFTMTNLKICIAGATGWAGSALARAVGRQPDMALVAGVWRAGAGKRLGGVLGGEGLDAPLFGRVEEALERGPDVFVEYTKPGVAKGHVLAALRSGAHVVVGTSG